MKRLLVGFALLGACAGGPDPSTDVDTDQGVDTQDPDTQPPDTDASDTDASDTDASDTDDTDPADTDPVDTDPADTDPVDTDPADTDPVDTDPVDTDPADTDPVDTDTDTDDGIVIPDTDTDTADTDPDTDTGPGDTDPADTDDTDPADTDDTDPADTDDTDPADTDDTDPADTDDTDPTDTDDTDPTDTDDTDPTDTDDTDPTDTDDSDPVITDCDFTATFANPQFAEEHGWAIEDFATGDVVASQGFPGVSTGLGVFTSSVTLGTGYYVLVQLDSWGDGWNGGTFTLENSLTGDLVFDEIGLADPGPPLGVMLIETLFAVECSDGVALPLFEDCAGDEYNLVDMFNAVGDGVCDDGSAGFDLTCEAFAFDDGDCGDVIQDCDGQERLATDIGDGTCDNGLFCAEFDWDAGDCDAVPLSDCDGNEFDAGLIRSALGDGTCDDGTSGPNLDCPDFANDDGDCRDVILFEDFDAGCAGWVFGEEWECGAPTSGPGAAWSGDDVLATNLDGDYSPNRTLDLAHATYDGIVLPNEIVEASFRVWQIFETCCDGFHVSVSTDGGATYVAAPAINPPFSGFTGIQPLWRRDAPDWNVHTVDLSEWAGETISLRFAMRSDGSVERAGAYVDDLTVYALTGGVEDCDGTLLRPEGLGAVGDGVCDLSFNCAAFNFDEGDCGAVSDPDDCPAGSSADCDGVCFDNVLINGLVADGDCNDAFGPNLFCAEAGWDGGDCGDLVTDCTGDLTPEGFLANGVCDEAFFCFALGYDNGDCDSETVLDCAGNPTNPAAVLAAAGDGTCDDGSTGLDLQCPAFAFDDGDCIGVVFEEDFETGCAGWVFGNSTWACGVPTSGPNAARTGDSVLATVLSGNYPSSQVFTTATATYAGIALPNDRVELDFFAWERFEVAFDGFTVLVSVSGEDDFRFATPVVPQFTHNLPGGPAWSRNTQVYNGFAVDLTPWAGETIDLRFAMRSDGGIEFPGAYIDDLQVLSVAAADFDCDGVPVSPTMLEFVGDGYCDLRYNCAAYNFDDGDCAPVADPADCPPVSTADCDGVCFFDGDIADFTGNGTCDESLPNLNCATSGFDDGDCGAVATDCNGEVILAEQLGDGVCDDNLFCIELDWDAGDCDDEPIEDCDGTLIDVGDLRAALGDGTCDDGSAGINLFCEDFANDDGDCVSGLLFDDMSDCGLWTFGDEWACGVPTSGPNAAFSGSQVIATNLAGDYDPNRRFASAHATRAPISLPAGELLELRFRSWFSLDIDASGVWDSYRVEVSTNGGASFEVAPPIDPGHAPVIGGFGPAYSAANSGGAFVQKRVDLSGYGGQDVLIRFAFHSDGFVQRPGAYIDQLEVISFGGAAVVDCSGAAVVDPDTELQAVGDGICDARFNCAEFSFDDGDCDPVSDPEAANACPSGASVDCDGVCFANGQLTTRQGNGVCDDGVGGPNLFCAARGWDGGDCATLVSDCEGGIIPESFIGDGVCQPELICGQTSFDDGDCDSEALVDCDGASTTVGLVRAAYGDSTCDDGSTGVNLNCELFQRDGGDCTSLILSENFDSGCVDWTFGAEWACGVPTSGPGAALSGDSVLATNLAGLYANSRDWAGTHATYEGLVLPLAEIEVEFRAWYNFERSTAGTNFDGFHVSVSTDGGVTYDPVTSVTPAYNGVSSGLPSWSGVFEQWNVMRADLTSYAGQTVNLRFAMRSDGSVQRVGAYIDDLTVRSFGDVILACDGVTPVAEALLGDGTCDEALFCEDYDDDDGDCLLACDGVTPFDSAALGDGVCDAALGCEEYDLDDGDCVLSCDTGLPFDAAAIGDGVCNPELYCEEFDFDDGDCLLACDGVTPFTAAALGDGVCDSALNCVEYGFDDGDCSCGFTVQLTVGAFAFEYGWEIFNESGALVATSGETPASPGGGPGPAVTDIFVEQGGLYTFVAHDSYGDGWVNLSGVPDGFFTIIQGGQPISLLDEDGEPLLDGNGDPVTVGTVDDQGLAFVPISQTYQFVVDCSPCPEGESQDCNEVCFADGLIEDALNNGVCDDGEAPAINLACAAYNFDNFTCDVPSDCPDGEEPDCDGNCFIDPFALVGDLVCHDGSDGEPNLLCEDFFFDFGDCD